MTTAGAKLYVCVKCGVPRVHDLGDCANCKESNFALMIIFTPDELAAHTKEAEDRGAAAMKEAISKKGCTLGFNQSGSTHNHAVHAFYTSLMKIDTPDAQAHDNAIRQDEREKIANEIDCDCDCGGKCPNSKVAARIRAGE